MRWKLKSPLVIGLVVISAITVWKLGLLPANIYASECQRKAGYIWDYDTNDCIPEPAYYCEQDGGTWDWADEVCIPADSEEEKKPCPDGYEQDVWGVCMPIPPKTTTTTPKVPEFPLMNSLILLGLVIALIALFKKW